MNVVQFTFACTLLIANIARPSEPPPSLGMVYNTKERSALRYDCEQTGAKDLKCRFIQVSVRMKTKPEDIPEKVANLEKLIAEEKMTPDKCKDARDNVKALRDKSLPGIKEMPRQDYEAALEGNLALVTACDTGSFEAFRKMARQQIEAELKSCTVSLNPFEQTFQKVESAGDKGQTWVASNPPDGPCGIVQLSRFELVEIYPGAKSYMWNYVARRAVTNPAQEHPVLGSCKILDESEFPYVWQQSRALPKWIECDQIEFSPF